MTNLSKELIAKLNENYYIDNLEILKKQVSVDGTKKYLIKLPTRWSNRNSSYEL